MKYEQSAEYFEDTVAFLASIGLVNIDNNIIVTPSDLSKNRESLLSDYWLKEYILCAMLNSNSPIFETLNEYLSQFNISGNISISNPRIEERIRKHGIRNILIELGLVIYESYSDQYVIPNDHSFAYVKHLEKKGMSQADLDEILRKQKVLGDLAEEAVVEYVRARLSNNLDLSRKVKRISQFNSNAGYDILSYESHLDGNNSPRKRFIEVKAVSIKDYSFYWSRNEIDTSKKYGDRYYLYLLPVLKVNQVDTSVLKIIQNPNTHVLEDKDWGRTI